MAQDTVQKSQTLRIIPETETFSPSTKYLGNRKIEAVFAIRRDSKGPRYEKRSLFDFSKVSDEQMHILAMYGAKVRVQAVLRTLSPDVMLNPETLSTIDVLGDVIEGERSPSDPASAATKGLMKALGVSEEVARSILADAKTTVEKTKAAGNKPQPKTVKAA